MVHWLSLHFSRLCLLAQGLVFQSRRVFPKTLQIDLAQIFAKHQHLIAIVLLPARQGKAGEQYYSISAHKIVLGEHGDMAVPEMRPQLLRLFLADPLGGVAASLV